MSRLDKKDMALYHQLEIYSCNKSKLSQMKLTITNRPSTGRMSLWIWLMSTRRRWWGILGSISVRLIRILHPWWVVTESCQIQSSLARNSLSEQPHPPNRTVTMATKSPFNRLGYLRTRCLLCSKIHRYRKEMRSGVSKRAQRRTVFSS